MLYDILDHTADLRVKVYGNTYETIFENSVTALSDLIIDQNAMGTNITRTVKIEKETLDDIFIELLNNILFYLETENILFHRARVTLSSKRLTATLYGSEIPENSEYRHLIKAVTYYNLEIHPEDGFAIFVMDV